MKTFARQRNDNSYTKRIFARKQETFNMKRNTSIQQSLNSEKKTSKPNCLGKFLKGFVPILTHPIYAIPLFLLIFCTFIGEIISKAGWAKAVETEVSHVMFSLAAIGCYLFLAVRLVRLAVDCWVPEKTSYFITGMILFTLLVLSALLVLSLYALDAAVCFDSVIQAWHARSQ